MHDDRSKNAIELLINKSITLEETIGEALENMAGDITLIELDPTYWRDLYQ